MAEETRYLVLDSRIIADVEDAKLTLGEVSKHPEYPLFTEDKPWEPRYDNVYPDVIYDEDEKIYKCWYNPFVVDARVTSTPPEHRHPDVIKYNDVKPTDREIGLCYAVSKDGIRWDKPELGMAEFEGGTTNNIVTRRRGVAGIYKDDRDPDAARRYKMFFSASRGTFVAFSPDGLHWDELIPVPGHEGGNRPSAFWSPHLGKYVVITRRNSELGRRQVTQTESSDFVTWRRERSIMEGPTVATANPRHDRVSDVRRVHRIGRRDDVPRGGFRSRGEAARRTCVEPGHRHLAPDSGGHPVYRTQPRRARTLRGDTVRLGHHLRRRANLL